MEQRKKLVKIPIKVSKDMPPTLQTLLTGYLPDAAVEKCLDASATGQFKFMAGAPASIELVRSAYAVRATINIEMNNSRVEGLTDLLSNLDATTAEKVVINALYCHEEKFVIVTDANMTTLLGLEHILKGQDEPFDYDLGWP